MLKTSNTNVLLKLIELVTQQCQLSIYLSAVLDHLVYLVRESHVLCLLWNQVILYLVLKTLHLLVQFHSRLLCGLFGLELSGWKVGLEPFDEFDFFVHLFGNEIGLFFDLAQLTEHRHLLFSVEAFLWWCHDGLLVFIWIYLIFI